MTAGAVVRRSGLKNAADVLLQIWFTLSDEGVEDAIYDSYAMEVHGY